MASTRRHSVCLKHLITGSLRGQDSHGSGWGKIRGAAATHHLAIPFPVNMYGGPFESNPNLRIAYFDMHVHGHPVMWRKCDKGGSKEWARGNKWVVRVSASVFVLRSDEQTKADV